MITLETVSLLKKQKLTMIAEVPVTLRKRITFIMAGHENVCFAGLGVEEALSFLRDADYSSVELISPTGKWSINYIAPLKDEEKNLWLGQPPPS